MKESKRSLIGRKLLFVGKVVNTPSADCLDVSFAGGDWHPISIKAISKQSKLRRKVKMKPQPKEPSRWATNREMRFV